MRETSQADTSSLSSALRLAALLAALGATVFVFSAGQLHFGNPREFSTPFLSLALGGGLLVLVLAVLGAASGWLMPAAAALRIEAVAATLTILCWIQGTFLLWDYGVLDGSPIQWGEFVGRGIADSALWIVGLAVAFYCHRRLGPALVKAALVLVAIQTIALASVWLPSSGEPVAAQPPANPEPMYGFSAESNVLHVVMDGFQSDIFQDILSGESGQEIRDSLDGFTFFDEHTGTFPYTEVTMPLILSGKVYRNEVSVPEFTAEVMRQPNVLNAALDAGFEVDIAANPSVRSVYAQSRHTNAYTIPANLHAEEVDYFLEDALRLADLSLFRVAPHFFRFLIHQDELWMLQRLSVPGNYPNLRYFSDIEFLRQLRDRMTTSRRKPVYKLFHLMISHRPTVGTADCEFEGVVDTSRETVTDQSTCGLRRVLAVLERMRELGIYDDTLVVLMADHGAWVAAERYLRNLDQHDGPKASMAALAVPLLAIKPPRSTGPLRTSSAPTDIGDVATTVATLMDFEAALPGRNVFELEEDDERVRYFYNYAYGDNHKKKGYLYTMLEYRVDGNPFDAASWRRTRRFRPGGLIEDVDSESGVGPRVAPSPSTGGSN